LTVEWTFYATATWVSKGEVKSIRSNEISVPVNPPIFQTLESELLVRKPKFYSMLDWSPDGRHLLGAIHSTGGDALGLMDIDNLKVTRLPIEFGPIQHARFSASGNLILVLPWRGSDSAVWFSDLHSGEERMMYGKMIDTEGKTPSYEMWSARPDGSDATKLHTFSLTEGSRMWIYDAHESDILMKSSEPLGFPRTENKVFIFNVDTKESSTVMETGGDGGGPQLLRFSPAGDNILFDDGPDYRTPGGPISIVSADGEWSETFYTRQLKFDSTYSDPTSYAVSPDGRFVAAYMEL
jgi:hypothetical protein